MQKMKKMMVRGGVVLGSLGLLAGQAMAAVPAEVTSALNDAKADGVAIGGVVLGVIIAIAAFKYIRRAL
ncbi:major capsid protein [Pseudomonas aeruginosa]